MLERTAKAVFHHETVIARRLVTLSSLLSPKERRESSRRISRLVRRERLSQEIRDRQEFAVLDAMEPPPPFAASEIPDQEQEARAWGDKPARTPARPEVRS